MRKYEFELLASSFISKNTRVIALGLEINACEIASDLWLIFNRNGNNYCNTKFLLKRGTQQDIETYINSLNSQTDKGEE